MIHQPNDVTGLTVSAARVEAERLKKEVKYEGADPIEDRRQRAVNRAQEKASKVLVKDLFECWAATDLINRKDQGAEARRMISKDVLPFIGDLNIKDVRKGHITEILGLSQTLGNSSIVNTRNSGLFNAESRYNKLEY